MDNTIHVNTTSRLMHALIRQQRPASVESSFGDALGQAASAREDYKHSIENQIAQMKVDPTRTSDNFRISISDDGFEAMRADPEYEQFVLDAVRRELSAPNPLHSLTGSSTVILRFGSEPRQFRADSLPHGDSAAEIAQEGDKKTWWEERMEQQEKSAELDEKIAQVRGAAKRLAAAKLQRGEAVSAADLSAASEVLTLLLAEFLATPEL
ncbi:MAG: hypothetical protein HDQ87_06095 [Clostridia bacterium]|nr:hypothetical protein [Clostridia bacterium]